MQSVKSCVLRHLSLRARIQPWNNAPPRAVFLSSSSSAAANPAPLVEQVIALVKRFDKADASKVNETAHFQKDLCLDSLDKVELVMAIEEEFSIEIPDDKADKFVCCADVAKYIAAETERTAI